MKINRRLSAALVVLVTLFTGCQEELKTGIDTNCPAPEDFTYDLDFSAEKSIAVYWDASKAITAGARSFTVQLTPHDNFNRGDNYNATISKTLQITDDIYDSVTFTNLGSDDIYYVRVRANYPYSKYSEWVYLSYNAKPAPYAVGYGPVDSAAVNLTNIAYDVATSTTDKMVFTFDNAENASLVRIQLINYTTLAVTKTVTLAADATSIEFASLSEGDQYSVRARTEYEENGYVKVASWKEFTAEATKDDGTVVETNVFEVGKGPVVPKDVPPVGKFVEATSSTLTFSWSESDFASVVKDTKRPYRIELFKDADCQELEVGWDISANNAIYKSKTPTFLFSGLDQNTTYYFRVTDTESDLTCEEVVSGTTEAFTVTTISETKANAGDVILAEDFSELIWGGDYLNGFAGYSATDRSSATAFDKAQGLNGKDGTAWGWYLVDNATEIGLFNTLKKAVASSRLATWGIIAETTPAGHICARPGMLKLGASSYAAHIVTPELSSLKETATIEVSFKAALYGSDNTSGGVYVVNTTDNNDCLIEKYDEQLAEQYPLEKKWKKETFTLNNISPSSRIAIGNARTPGTTPGKDQQRMFVDEIVIKVVSYGSVAIALDKPVAEIGEVTDASIEVKWNAVTNATGYLVEYKKATDTEWASTTASGTSCVISGLEGETAYEVRVYATASGDNKSEASEVVTATTLKPAALEIAAVFFSDAKVTWPANASATGYVAYLNGAKVADVEAGATSYTFTGLSKGTQYTAKIGVVTAAGETMTPEVSFKTADIRQIRDNVGPTHICIDWDDCSGGTTNTQKLFHVELYKDAAATQPVYSLYTVDGQSAAGGCFGASSWMGKAGGTNITPATRVSFGMLEPGTTYYFRIKTEAAKSFDTQKGKFDMTAPNGTSEYSELVAFTTEPAHTASANEILFEGFDIATIQADFINNAAGLTPYTTDKANISFPWADWCVYPFATSHKFGTWGFAAKGAYVDGKATHNGYNNYVATEKAGSLAGWHLGDEVTPNMGCAKVGTSSKVGFYIGTPALNSSLLAAEGTPCTFSFKASALMTDAREIYIEKYDAATKTFSTVKEITLKSQLVEGDNFTSSDYTFIGEWETYTVDVTLAPGDNLSIVTKGKNRFVVDDILIVKK